ncbi:MAG TPA: glycosyltransferase family 4 protein [Thermodesulfovibrionales bacterium]|nr:glycosyltransferase family 4 protein [Thermodesulfovibrionales bacterium]
MKVLIINAVKGWNGIGSHSLELALALRKQGHHPILCCSHEINVTHYARQYDLPIKHIRLRNSMDILWMLRIIIVVLGENIKVIVTNLGKEYWPAILVARLLGLKVIVVRHQTNIPKKITCRLLDKHADRIVAVSHAVRNSLIAGGISSEKIDVIHNAINLDRFDPSSVNSDEVRAELGIGEKDIVVGTSGRLCSEKGGLYLVRAVHSLIKNNSSVKLLFVGEGPCRTELEDEAKALSVNGNIIITGFRNDMKRMYAAMDIFVLPSTCEEAFGIAVIEAMAMMKPVIGTTVGGIPEIITNGTNGILIPKGKHAALVEAIDRLMGDAEFSRRIAREGRKTVERRFSEKNLGNRFEIVLNKALKQESRGLLI